MRSVLGDDGFRLALVLSVVGVCAVVVVAQRFATHLGSSIVALVAAVVALRVDVDAPIRLVLALVALGLAARPVVGRRDRLLRAGLLLVGGLLVAAALPHIAGWMRVVAIAAAVASVPLGDAVDERVPRLVPLLLLVTAIGVYACVPDTEAPRVLLGAIGPTVFLAIHPDSRGGAPTGALLAVVVWSVMLGGNTRPGAVIGGLACFGVLLLVPFVRARWDTPTAAVTLLAVHGVLVLWVSRVAGLRQGAVLALVLALPAFAGAWAVLWWVGASARPRDEHRRRGHH